MDLPSFVEKVKGNLPVGTVLKNPGGGTFEVVSYTDARIVYLHGKSRISVFFEDLFYTYQRFRGKYVTSSDLMGYKPHVFDSDARPAGHSSNCTFLFLLLGKLGLAGDIEGAGKRGNSFGVRIE